MRRKIKEAGGKDAKEKDLEERPNASNLQIEAINLQILTSIKAMGLPL